MNESPAKSKALRELRNPFLSRAGVATLAFILLPLLRRVLLRIASLSLSRRSALRVVMKGRSSTAEAFALFHTKMDVNHVHFCS